MRDKLSRGANREREKLAVLQPASPALPQSLWQRATVHLVWIFPLFSILLIAAGIWLNMRTIGKNEGLGIPFSEFIMIIVYPIVGALIIKRQPGNAIGWIFCSMGLSASLAQFSTGYNFYVEAIGHTPQLLARLMSWISNWIFFPYLISLTLLMLLFPSGRPISPVCAGVSRQASTGASTAGATMPSALSRRSPALCATRWIWNN